MPLFRLTLFAVLAVSLLFLSSCDKKEDSGKNKGKANSVPAYDDYGRYGIDPGEIKFLDSAKSNSTPESKFAGLSFVNPKGEKVQLGGLIGKKNIVLVVLRGDTGPICPFCSTQTSRLISNYQKFTDRNAEVVLVYPVKNQEGITKLKPFMVSVQKQLSNSSTKVPFPVLLDVELKSVGQLGILKDLSKPATYLLDLKGNVRFAYVGATMADRPSIKLMLEQLDQLKPKAISEKEVSRGKKG